MNGQKVVIGATAVAVMALVGGGAAIAAQQGGVPNNGADSTGPGLERAKSAALGHTNGGRVTGTEVGDEEGYYEIEVTRDDGSQVDVHLDSDFNVLDARGDGDGPGD